MLTRTIKFIFLSQFLRFNPAVQKVYHASCTRIRAAARQQTSAPGLKSGFVGALYRDPCASAHLLKFCTGTQKWSLSKFVPRSRQHVINLVPGRQKLRHAFAPFGLRNMNTQNDKFCRRHSGRLSAKNEFYCRAVSCKANCDTKSLYITVNQYVA